MAMANDCFDANGYYSDGTGKHLEIDGGGLIIFRSQYNIGRKIVETVQKSQVLTLNDNQQPDGKRKFQDINMLLLGPIYKSLRDQTRRDLGNFLKERVKLDYKRIQFICEHCVLNSSLVRNNYEKMPFIKVLRQNPLNVLHVLVFDEAHWGINSEGVIDNFFQHLANVRKEITEKEKSKPSLIVLLLSATIDVLTRVIRCYTDDTQRVDWSKLRHTDSKRFGAPEYRDIFGLRLYNDQNPNILRQLTMAQRSEVVITEYYKTIDACLKSFSVPQNTNWQNHAAWKALKFLLHGDSVNEIARRACSIDYDATDNCMVLLRLELNDHVRKLYDAIIDTFQTASARYNCEVRPFEVIQLIQDSDSISKQLSSKAIRHLLRDGRVVDEDLDISQLQNLPCLILVNDRLGMGERLPSHCMGFDVRSRYKGDAANMKGFEATFIQDIGRCCGHKKPEALVLMSITDEDGRASGDTGQLILKDIKFPQLHGLLTKNQRPGASHTEKNSKVFTILSSSSIILDAEPQIGKTGAVMAMLDILYSEHTFLSKPTSPIPPVTARQITTKKSNELQELTAQLCKIVDDSNEPLDARIKKLKTTLRTNNLFQYYHHLIEQFEEAKKLSEAIYHNSLIAPMNSARRAKQDHFLIADCGCGLHGIVHMFRANSSDLDLPVHIIGIDLHESILTLQNTGSVPNVIFIGHVADMASTDKEVIANSPFNVVLYCSSLFENDITRHIIWANRQLKMGGVLIIADVIRRFSNNFEISVKKYGFKCQNPYKICDLFQVWSFEKVSSNIDETQTVLLKPY